MRSGIVDGTAVGGRRRGVRVPVWAAVAVIPLAVDYAHLRGVPPLLHTVPLHTIGAVAQSSPWAAGISVLLMIANTFLPLPGESVGVVNGAVFGFWGGFAISWIGVMCSAVLAFAIGRALAGCTIARGRLHLLLTYADKLVERGWHAALVIRFCPLLPFTIFNVALGRAKLGWGTFLWTTALGVLPPTVLLVAAGCGVAGAQAMLWWSMPGLGALLLAGVALRPRLGRYVGAPARKAA